MYELTKIYKTKAMAVNAIRMTATNKGWKVLSTDDAAQHVWPQAEGFAVNNTSLNLALGFISEADADALTQRVPDGSVTDGKALEAASAALTSVKDALTTEEVMADAKARKLQAPSKLEESKKAAKAAKKADKAPKGTGEEGRSATRCNVVNGARRPLRGKTLLVWETTEMLAAGPNGIPTLKEVYEELCRLEPGFNKTTAGIQYYACRAYNGWESKK